MDDEIDSSANSLKPSVQNEGTVFFHLIGKFLEYFLLQYVLFKRFSLTSLIYTIEDQIFSPATRIIFTRSKRTDLPICLKVWQRCNNELYDTEDAIKCIDYLLEGLKFNRRLAPRVYLGIAPIEISENAQNTQEFRRGWLIRHPKKSKLMTGQRYALVMLRLDENWRLDHQLRSDKLGTRVGMEFLAREVAIIHQALKVAPRDLGKPDSIPMKLVLNTCLFNDALNNLADNYEDIEKYRPIGDLMERACEGLARDFEQRYRDGHIKRCHGDLKATNLWVQDKSFLWGIKKFRKRLLALDCVDFNPEFCHIDTLSDVAMLAIEIEMRLTNWLSEDVNEQYEESPAQHFLYTYLEKAQEDCKTLWPLLHFYMAEKSMICAYMCILFDGLPTLGKKYLEVALNHAQELEKLLTPNDTFLQKPGRGFNNVGSSEVKPFGMAERIYTTITIFNDLCPCTLVSQFFA
jgi:aminoglycoside phosphotransferase family enzyme